MGSATPGVLVCYIQKSDDSFRSIHDGTHGTGVNSHIKVRDQQEVPSAGDLKQAMRELDGATFVFAADVNVRIA